MLKSIKNFLDKNSPMLGSVASVLLIFSIVTGLSIVGKYIKMIEDANYATVGPESTLSRVDAATSSLTSQMTDFKEEVKQIPTIQADVKANGEVLKQMNRTLDLAINPPSADEIKSLRARVSILEAQLSETRVESSELKKMISDISIKTETLSKAFESLKNTKGIQSMPSEYQTDIKNALADLKDKIDSLKGALPNEGTPQ